MKHFQYFSRQKLKSRMYNLDLVIKSRAASELQQYFVSKIVLSTPFHACRMQEIQDGTMARPTRRTTFTTIIKTTLTLKTILACVSIFSFKYYHDTVSLFISNFRKCYKLPSSLFVILVPDCLNSIEKKKVHRVTLPLSHIINSATTTPHPVPTPPHPSEGVSLGGCQVPIANR